MPVLTSPYKFVHATVSLLLRFGGFYQRKLQYSLATSWEMQAVVVAEVIKGSLKVELPCNGIFKNHNHHYHNITTITISPLSQYHHYHNFTTLTISPISQYHHYRNHHHHNHHYHTHHHYHDITTITITIMTTTIIKEVSHESFVFTSSTLTFWGMSRTKALFSHLQLSLLERCLARKLRFHIFNFHFLREVSHESFVFTSSTFTFWGKSRTKCVFES